MNESKFKQNMAIEKKRASQNERKRKQRAARTEFLTRIYGVRTADALATKLYNEWMKGKLT